MLIKQFEINVIEALASDALGVETVQRIFSTATEVSCEFTGVGYFLEIRHPELPTKRHVCSEPQVSGYHNNLQVGFVLFIEDGALTLECHTYGNESLPTNFRECNVQIET